jgi:hypothetical protein
MSEPGSLDLQRLEHLFGPQAPCTAQSDCGSPALQHHQKTWQRVLQVRYVPPAPRMLSRRRRRSATVDSGIDRHSWGFTCNGFMLGADRPPEPLAR